MSPSGIPKTPVSLQAGPLLVDPERLSRMVAETKSANTREVLDIVDASLTEARQRREAAQARQAERDREQADLEAARAERERDLAEQAEARAQLRRDLNELIARSARLDLSA